MVCRLGRRGGFAAAYVTSGALGGGALEYTLHVTGLALCLGVRTCQGKASFYVIEIDATRRSVSAIGCWNE